MAARYAYTVAQRNEDELHAALSSMSPPLPGFMGLCGNGASVEVLFASSLSDADKTRLDAVVSSYAPSSSWPTMRQRQQAVAEIGDQTPGKALLRAVMLTLLDEVNTLRTAASLPVRTAAQMRAAVVAKLNSGAADQ